METRCAACGKPIACGFDDPAGCWCARLPALPARELVTGAACLCETCLRARLAEVTDERRA
jgi:Cysteine-rich CWC